jgi:amidase
MDCRSTSEHGETLVQALCSGGSRGTMKVRMSPPGKSREDGALSRRSLLQLGLATTAVAVSGRAMANSVAAASDAGAPFGLEEATLAELQERLQTGVETARSLTEKYLSRIAALDSRLRAILETSPDALLEAEALDRERKSGAIRGPLHGIPVLLKDNIATQDRMHTTAGSLALMDATVPRDAFLVARLRAAGAVLLGKSNLSEWANFRSNPSSGGWSGRGGQCRNPYALDRSPSGSSSGSGTAVAANLCALAVGTETDGSIVSPSAACGLVGLKPTVGLVSRSGVIPISPSQDTAGPMARTVRDAAILLGVVAGRDATDAGTQRAGAPGTFDFTRTLDVGGLRGARIGVPRPVFFGYSPPTDALAEKALAVLRDAGATLVDPAPIPNAARLGEPELEVLLFEFKTALDAYLRGLGGNGPRSLAELIDFNKRNSRVELVYFGQDIFTRAQAKGPLTEPAYKKALALCQRLARKEGIDAVMDRHRLDALVAPTQTAAWLIDLVNGDSVAGSSTTPAAVAGYPSITVPMGEVHGLPVGLSFFGRAWSEPTLLKLAYAYEQATHHRQPPQLLASAPLG